jgi:hypothetical protein
MADSDSGEGEKSKDSYREDKGEQYSAGFQLPTFYEVICLLFVAVLAAYASYDIFGTYPRDVEVKLKPVKVESASDSLALDSLQSEIEKLNAQMTEQRNYLSGSIYGERTTYAAILTVIGALFVLISYGVVRWRISWTEKKTQRMVDNMEEKITGYVDNRIEAVDDSAQSRISNLFGEIGRLTGEVENLDRVVELKKGEVLRTVAESIYNESVLEDLSVIILEAKGVKLVEEYFTGTSTQVGEPKSHFTFAMVNYRLSNLKNMINNIDPARQYSPEKAEQAKEEIKELFEYFEDQKDRVALENMYNIIDGVA